MDDLIALLEIATEGNRELDDAIRKVVGAILPAAVALGHNDGCWVRRVGKQILEIGSHRDSGSSSGDYYLPRYTTSLDAALTLMPEGKDWGITRISPEIGNSKPLIYEAEFYPRDFWHDKDRIIVEAKTSPIAICIVALKARNALKD